MKTTSTTEKTVSMRLPVSVIERLDRLAKKTGRTKTYYMSEAVIEHLGDMEDLYVAEQRYLEFLKSDERAIPLEKLMEKYGLDN